MDVGSPPATARSTAEPNHFFNKLPRELRDKIYDLLHHHSHTLWVNRLDGSDLERNPADLEKEDDEFDGSYFVQADFKTRTSIPQPCLLTSQQFKAEYEDSCKRAHNRLEVVYNGSFRYVGKEMQYPALARRSTGLVFNAVEMIGGQCFWCDLYDQHGDFFVHGVRDLVSSLPELESIRLNLRCSHRVRYMTRLGCDISEPHCEGLEYLHTQMADDFHFEGLTRPGRLPKPLRIEISFHARENVGRESWECFTCWTTEGGLQTDLEAARRCQLEVLRT